MTHFRRFGRRFSVPSTLEIAHELRAFPASEDANTANEQDLPKTEPGEGIVAHRSPLKTASDKGAST
jgi:hypothetical protein